MKGIVFLGERQLELRDFPDPAPGPRDVILEIKASGMCGTDLGPYRAKSSPNEVRSGFRRLSGPVIAGHEPSGIVVEVGSAVSEREARIGDRVMNHHYDGCGVCRQITLMGHWTFSKVGQADCARFVSDRKIDLDGLFTHKWKLEQADEAYRLFDQQKTGKGVFLPS